MQKLAFPLTHAQIIGTHHCGNVHQKEFKCPESCHYVLCHIDIEERLLSIFTYQIKSEYYGVNRYASIEGITLEHFYATDKITPSSSLQS